MCNYKILWLVNGVLADVRKMLLGVRELKITHFPANSSLHERTAAAKRYFGTLVIWAQLITRALDGSFADFQWLPAK